MTGCRPASPPGCAAHATVAILSRDHRQGDAGTECAEITGVSVKIGHPQRDQPAAAEAEAAAHEGHAVGLEPDIGPVEIAAVHLATNGQAALDLEHPFVTKLAGLRIAQAAPHLGPRLGKLLGQGRAAVMGYGAQDHVADHRLPVGGDVERGRIGGEGRVRLLPDDAVQIALVMAILRQTGLQQEDGRAVLRHRGGGGQAQAEDKREAGDDAGYRTHERARPLLMDRPRSKATRVKPRLTVGRKDQLRFFRIRPKAIAPIPFDNSSIASKRPSRAVAACWKLARTAIPISTDSAPESSSSQ